MILALAAWHVFAITIAALPPACAPGRDGSDEAEADSAAVVVADGAAAAAWRTCRAVVSATRPVLRPVERLTGSYIRAVSLRQQWDMFSRPPRHNDFVQLRYYVHDADALPATSVERESVYPASANGLRLPAGRYFEEKAIRNARQRMLRHLREQGVVRRASDLPADLRPLLRYYSARYRSQLGGDRRLLRTEIWLGSAPIAAPGTPVGSGSVTPVGTAGSPARVPDARAPGPAGRIGTRELEGDIGWTLYDVLREREP